MGIDLGSLWGTASQAVSSATTTVEQIGVPALTASLEQWGANVLQTQATQTQATVNRAVQNMPASPPGSLSAAFGGVMQTAAISKFSVPIVIGVVAVAFLVMSRKG